MNSVIGVDREERERDIKKGREEWVSLARKSKRKNERKRNEGFCFLFEWRGDAAPSTFLSYASLRFTEIDSTYKLPSFYIMLVNWTSDGFNSEFYKIHVNHTGFNF